MKKILPTLMIFLLSGCASEYYHRSTDGVYYADGDYYNYNQSYDSYYGYPSYYSEYGYSGNSNIYYSSYYPDRWGVTYSGGRYGPYRSSFISLGLGFSSCSRYWSFSCDYPYGAWYSSYRPYFYSSMSPWFYNDWWWYNRWYYRHNNRYDQQRYSHHNQPRYNHRHDGHKPNRLRTNHGAVNLNKPLPQTRSLQQQILGHRQPPPQSRSLQQQIIDRQQPRLRSNLNSRQVNAHRTARYNRLQNHPNTSVRDINAPRNSSSYNKPLRIKPAVRNNNPPRVQQRYTRQALPANNRRIQQQRYNKPMRQTTPIKSPRIQSRQTINHRPERTRPQPRAQAERTQIR